MGDVSQKKHWDEFWSESRSRGEVYSTDMRIVKHLLEHTDPAGKRILEVGAGTGRDSAELAAQGSKVIALDYSEESIRIMDESGVESLFLVCGEAMELPFPDGTFDVVFHQGLLEHFKNPLDLLKENSRVLKRGGLLLVDVPQKYHYYTILKHMMMRVGVWFAGWETEFSAKELRSIVEMVGMEVIDVYGENLSPSIWYRGTRKILLRLGISLPMYPFFCRWTAKATKVCKGLMPGLYPNISMVIGTVARKV